MTTENIKCPFNVGDTVRYNPSQRGRDLADPDEFEFLKIGNTYQVVGVVKDFYVVVEGLEDSPGGGIYWTEFEELK